MARGVLLNLKESKEMSHAGSLVDLLIIPNVCNTLVGWNLSVTVTKDQAGSADQGRPITSKFSAFFLYQIRLRSVVFLVK